MYLLVGTCNYSDMSFQELLLGNTHTCSVCLNRVTVDELHGVSCGHMFCAQCWDIYCQVQIQQGITTGMEMFHFICICWHCRFKSHWRQNCIYSRTSVAPTLMARLPRLFRTSSGVPRKNSRSCRFGII